MISDDLLWCFGLCFLGFGDFGCSCCVFFFCLFLALRFLGGAQCF